MSIVKFSDNGKNVEVDFDFGIRVIYDKLIPIVSKKGGTFEFGELANEEAFEKLDALLAQGPFSASTEKYVLTLKGNAIRVFDSYLSKKPYLFGKLGTIYSNMYDSGKYVISYPTRYFVSRDTELVIDCQRVKNYAGGPSKFSLGFIDTNAVNGFKLEFVNDISDAFDEVEFPITPLNLELTLSGDHWPVTQPRQVRFRGYDPFKVKINDTRRVGKGLFSIMTDSPELTLVGKISGAIDIRYSHLFKLTDMVPTTSVDVELESGALIMSRPATGKVSAVGGGSSNIAVVPFHNANNTGTLRIEGKVGFTFQRPPNPYEYIKFVLDDYQRDPDNYTWICKQADSMGSWSWGLAGMNYDASKGEIPSFGDLVKLYEFMESKGVDATRLYTTTPTFFDKNISSELNEALSKVPRGAFESGARDVMVRLYKFLKVFKGNV